MGFFGRLFGRNEATSNDPVEVIVRVITKALDRGEVVPASLPVKIALGKEPLPREVEKELMLVGAAALHQLLDAGYVLADQTKAGLGILDLPREQQDMAVRIAIGGMQREGVDRCSLLLLPKDRGGAEAALANIAGQNGIPIEPIARPTDAFTLRLGLLERRLQHLAGGDAGGTEAEIEARIHEAGYAYVHGEVATWFRAIGDGGRHGALVFPSLTKALELAVVGRSLYGRTAELAGTSALYDDPWLPIVSGDDGGVTVWEVLLAEGQPDRVRKRNGLEATPAAETVTDLLDQLVPVRGL